MPTCHACTRASAQQLVFHGRTWLEGGRLLSCQHDALLDAAWMGSVPELHHLRWRSRAAACICGRAGRPPHGLAGRLAGWGGALGRGGRSCSYGLPGSQPAVCLPLHCDLRAHQRCRLLCGC